jgi:hypothetical protein
MGTPTTSAASPHPRRFGSLPVAKKAVGQARRRPRRHAGRRGRGDPHRRRDAAGALDAGHAWDHLCWYMPEERALFTGDVVLGAGTTVIPPDGDLADYLTRCAACSSSTSR